MLKIPAKIFGIILICLVVTGNASIEADDGDAQNIAKIKWLYPPKYFYGNDFNEGRAWVQEEKGGTWMLLDDNGNTLKEGIEAKHIFPYREGLALFELPKEDSKQEMRGFFDLSGDVVFSPIHFRAYGLMYSDGLIAETDENGSYGFMDMKGEWVILPHYDSTFFYSEGLAPVRKDNKWGYVDKGDNVKIDFIFDTVRPFSNGISIVSINSKYGVIDSNGN